MTDSQQDPKPLYDLARIRTLRESLIDCDVAVNDARAEIVRLLESFEDAMIEDADHALTAAVARRDAVAGELADAIGRPSV